MATATKSKSRRLRVRGAHETTCETIRREAAAAAEAATAAVAAAEAEAEAEAEAAAETAAEAAAEAVAMAAATKSKSNARRLRALVCRFAHETTRRLAAAAEAARRRLWAAPAVSGVSAASPWRALSAMAAAVVAMAAMRWRSSRSCACSAHETTRWQLWWLVAPEAASKRVWMDEVGSVRRLAMRSTRSAAMRSAAMKAVVRWQTVEDACTPRETA